MTAARSKNSMLLKNTYREKSHLRGQSLAQENQQMVVSLAAVEGRVSS
jgi:hypothetical protein